MADYKKIIPFILSAEGGYVNDPIDQGGETNKGVLYRTWKTVFGDTHDRFMNMDQADWNFIFKKFYWDAACADLIQSQRISNMLVDWIYNSGQHYPEADVQDILVHAFGANLVVDGNFGNATIGVINTVPEEELYNDIVQKRLWYYDQCVMLHPTNVKFLQGWKNRIANLQKFNNNLA